MGIVINHILYRAENEPLNLFNWVNPNEEEEKQHSEMAGETDEVQLPNKIHSDTSSMSSESKKNRWDKEQDKQLFETLKTLCIQAGVDVEEFGKIEKRMSEFKKHTLNELKEAHNWKGNIYTLRDRIRKRITEDDFTAREKRVLKRLLKQERDGLVSLDYVISQFAGKTMDQVLKYKAKHIKPRKTNRIRRRS